MSVCTLEDLKKTVIIEPIILTSIGGSPIHTGHKRVITESKRVVADLFARRENIKVFHEELCLIVLVNSNNFLLNKHGYVFQDEMDRAEVIDGFKDVNYTFVYDTPNYIDGAIRQLKPNFFTKGGDRTQLTVSDKEKKACEEVGCEIIYGVGGSDKFESSSNLLNKYFSWKLSKEISL